MPNWCNNNLTIWGPADLIKEIEGAELSLSKLIPWPKELDGVQKVTPVPEDEVEVRKALNEKYGASNLYDWCIANWGTKWDLDIETLWTDYAPDEDEEKLKTKSSLQSSFLSAWTPPVEAIKKIYEKYKGRDLNLRLEYFEPGAAFVGYAESNSGNFEDKCEDYSNADELEMFAQKNNMMDMLEYEISSLREDEEKEEE